MISKELELTIEAAIRDARKRRHEYLTAEHIQVTAETMAKYGVSKMPKVPVAKEYVKLEMLEAAKKELGLK